MKTNHTTKLLLIYLSKGLSFLSSYVLMLILFNKLDGKEFSYYASVGYLGFIVLTILDFGFSNYVILNKEINSNELLLVGLNKAKLFLTIFISSLFILTGIISQNSVSLLLACISLQQAFNFDGIYKIKNDYVAIIQKFFFGAFANFLLMGVLFISNLSPIVILIYTYLTGALINIYAFRTFVKSIFFNQRIDISAVKSTIAKFNWQQIFIYIIFNFFSTFTYSYYSYITKETTEHTYYNSNVIIISFISNLYVVYLIYREYIFTTSSLRSFLVDISLIGFLFLGSIVMYNYGFVVSLFGKTVVIETSDKILSSGLFVTLILKTELYFRMLKNYKLLKNICFVQVLLNVLLVLNSKTICNLFNQSLFFMPIVAFDLLVISTSVIIWYIRRKKLNPVLPL